MYKEFSLQFIWIIICDRGGGGPVLSQGPQGEGRSPPAMHEGRSGACCSLVQIISHILIETLSKNTNLKKTF